MLSRKASRTVALALLLTAGVAASSPARAARRGDPQRTAPARAEKVASPGLLASVLDFWGLVHFAQHGPPPPPTGGNDGGHNTGEGTGICPHGHM
jgi:hypothetical protein